MALVINWDGGNFLNIKFDGSTDFDLCAYIRAHGFPNCQQVTLLTVCQNSVAVNDELTVREGAAGGIAFYGPFKDVTGSGLVRYYKERICKPYVKGAEATANSKATFEFGHDGAPA